MSWIEKTIVALDNMSLDNAEEIIAELIKYGVYRPMKISSVIKEKWSTSKRGEFSEFLNFLRNH